jgi:hypothetical protein
MISHSLPARARPKFANDRGLKISKQLWPVESAARQRTVCSKIFALPPDFSARAERVGRRNKLAKTLS